MNEVENADALQAIFSGETYLVPEKRKVKLFSSGAIHSEKLKLLFILKNENVETASQSELEVIQKTADWKDLKLKREEVGIINIASQPTSVVNILKQFSVNNIVALGVEPQEIGLVIELHTNKVFKFIDMNFIFTSSIEELLKNEIIKNKFFAAIKSMFK
ncbi:MAG: hypothetical protein LH473_02320 [Chitinophagales bacterium]|nr:hypothetical protein [Chitinophagales bacterium]